MRVAKEERGRIMREVRSTTNTVFSGTFDSRAHFTQSVLNVPSRLLKDKMKNI